jgi:hypothetical protein
LILVSRGYLVLGDLAPSIVAFSDLVGRHLASWDLGAVLDLEELPGLENQLASLDLGDQLASLNLGTVSDPEEEPPASSDLGPLSGLEENRFASLDLGASLAEDQPALFHSGEAAFEKELAAATVAAEAMLG